MIKTLLLLTSFGYGTLCFCDTPDSSLYSTNFERDVFNSVSKKLPIDSIDLYVALSYQSGSDAKQKVSRFTSELKSRIADLPVNKKIKTVYKAVHEKFLSKYNEEAFFNDIFVNGNYNCVSASALYALVLEELGIRYTIKETPVHVYLIADPGNTGFLIESTLPGEKIIQFDERYKSQYIEYLHNNKIISDNEFSNTSIDELFNKYYSKDRSISIKQLAGLQYYNQGILLYNKADYDQSLASFEKAELLYDEDIIKYMKNNSLINLLNKENQQKKYRGDILGKYIIANDSNSCRNSIW